VCSSYLAEASKAMIANVMGISQQMVESMVQAQAEPTDDPMEKVAKVFKMLQPAMAALGNQNAASQQRLIPPPQQAPQQAAPAQQQAPQQPRTLTRATSPHIPDKQWISGGLHTVRRLETGELPGMQLFPALKWCSENLPPVMLNAIKAGDEAKVMEIGAEGMDDVLLNWIMDEQHSAFLKFCISVIQRMLLSAWDDAVAREAWSQFQQYHAAKGNPVPAEAEEKPKSEKRMPPPPPPADAEMAEATDAPEKPAEVEPAKEGA
jgi:hypothetical protein